MCILFVSDKCDLGFSEELILSANEKLINFGIPHIVTLKVTNIEKIALRDFKGIENCDEATRKTIMDFSLNIALGKMDEAFR